VSVPAECTVVPVRGEHPYDVVVGHGLHDRLPGLVAGATTVMVLTDPKVSRLAEAVADTLRPDTSRVEVEVLAPGEQAKSLDTAAQLWDALGRVQLTRSDVVVSVGGGATTDVAGFVAATWLRGVRVVHLPTTLLAMVDAAIGGKTAINTAAGKNLVGAFHPPAGVLVDLDALNGLPDAEWVNGMAEVVKAGFIADPAILDLVEKDPTAASTARGAAARELVERAIRVKAEVVSRDLREAGLREVLNYGHTLGHAIEQVEHYQMPHGHAVSVGLVFAAALGREAGLLDADSAQRHAAILRSIGLPTAYRADAFPELREAMRVDKKSRGARQRFVILEGVGKPAILDDPAEELLDSAYAEVAG
jgi:3-dehydroquinate synthase